MIKSVPWTTKPPQGLAEIDWSHWTSRGLLFAAPCGADGIHRDIVGRREPTVVHANKRLAVHPHHHQKWGIGSSHDGATDRSYDFGNVLDALPQITIVAFLTEGWAAGGGQLRYVAAKTNSGGNQGWELLHSTFGTDNYQFQTSTGSNQISGIDHPGVVGGQAILVARYDGKEAQLLGRFGNTILEGDIDAQSGSFISNTDSLEIGAGGAAGPTAYWQGGMFDIRIGFYGWSRAESLEFLRRPDLWWACYQPRRVVVAVPAAGGGFVVELTASSFGFSPQAITRLNATQLALTAQTFSFTPQAITWRQLTLVQLTAAAFNFTAQSLTQLQSFVAQLTAPAFNFTAHAIEEISGRTLIELTAATFNFTANALTWLQKTTLTLTAALFKFSPRQLAITPFVTLGRIFFPITKGDGLSSKLTKGSNSEGGF